MKAWDLTLNAGAVLLVSAADERYAMPLAVMLKSAERGLRPGVELRAHVIDGGLRAGSRARIARTLDPERTTLEWIRPDPTRLSGVPVFGHVSLSTYYRLLIPDLLPPEAERAVYVDADCIVLGDLAELGERDFGGCPLMAVPEGEMRVSSPDGIPAYRELGLPPDARCLNGGVLVLDLAAWRRAAISGRILEYLRTHRERVRFWDQDGLNAVLATRWVELERRWNYRVDCASPCALPAAEALAAIRRDAAIVHFASATKPWHYFADHPGRQLFLEHLQRTDWAGWSPRPPLRALRNPHFWGARLRRVPLLGRLWAAVRSP